MKLINSSLYLCFFHSFFNRIQERIYFFKSIQKTGHNIFKLLWGKMRLCFILFF